MRRAAHAIARPPAPARGRVQCGVISRRRARRKLVIMPSMSYCRFRNTLEDLKACADSFEDITSPDELKAAKKLIEVCQGIAEIDPDDIEIRAGFSDDSTEDNETED